MPKNLRFGVNIRMRKESGMRDQKLLIHGHHAMYLPRTNLLQHKSGSKKLDTRKSPSYLYSLQEKTISRTPK
jgi:hypothetical protein